MATASVPHDQRQPIEVIPPGPPPHSAGEADEATRIIAALDAVLALGVYVDFTLFAGKHADGLAEHVFRLWASAKKLELEDRTSTYEDGSTIRSLQLKGHFQISVLWDRVQPAVAAPIAPAPVTNVVPLPAPTATQSDAVTEPAQPRDLDDASVRMSLLEID